MTKKLVDAELLPLPGGITLTVTERCELYDWKDAWVESAVARAVAVERERAQQQQQQPGFVFGGYKQFDDFRPLSAEPLQHSAESNLKRIAELEVKVRELEAELESFSRGVKLQAPTATMEQEFSLQRRLGYVQAKEESRQQVDRLVETLKDDAFAITFQSMAQYRAALIAAIKQERKP